MIYHTLILIKYHITLGGNRPRKHEAKVFIAAMMQAAHISLVEQPIHFLNVVIHMIPILNGEGNALPSNLNDAMYPPKMLSIISFVVCDGFTYDIILNKYVSWYAFST